MEWLTKVSVKRPIFATVLILSVCVLGAVGYFALGVDRFPNVDIPAVTIVTRMDGTAPEEIENDITEKIEEAVNSIGGIDELHSYSSEGVSTVFIKFDLEKDGDVAAQEVRDKVSEIQGDLPKDAEAPVITKFDPQSTPIMYISVAADKPLREITELADKTLRRRLENVRGVGQVNILGGRERQIQVVVDPVRLRAEGVTAAEVSRAISAQNVMMPGGSLQNGPQDLTLRVRGRVATPGDIGAIIVRERGEHPLRVRDLADVEDGAEDQETVAVENGKSAVVMSIRMQSGANMVGVVDAVRERLAEMQPMIPEGVHLQVVRDNSGSVRTSVDSVKEHLILGAIFAALVVLLFLGNLRSTVIAAIAIPVSIIGTFALLWIEGFTLNTITLLALALAVGIVIDDAIVVLENIHRFIEEKGFAPARAAVEATKEIGLAVLATTMSLLAVFVPVAFMNGIVGRFLKSFGLTMAFAIAVSMLVSFTLTPMLCARWLKAHKRGEARKKGLLERIVDWGYLPLEGLYMRVLEWVMRRRWVVVVACVATLASIPPLMKTVDKGFLPKSDEAHFELNVRAPEGTSLEATQLIGERIAGDLRKLPGVKTTLLLIGDNQARTPNLASIYVRLTDPSERQRTQEDIMAIARTEVAAKQPKELQIDISEVPVFSGGPAEATVQFLLSGNDLEVLQKLSDAGLAKIKTIPGAVDVKSTLIGGKPEIAVSIDRDRAAALGVQVADVASTLRMLVGGSDVSTYSEGGQEYDVHMRASPSYRADGDALALMNVPSSTLGSVPLMDMVHLESGSGPAQIDRLGRRRTVQFMVNVAPGYSEGTIGAEVKKALASLNLPAGYTIEATGRSKEMAKTGKTFLLAFGMSLLFMYLILAAQFESWLHPITILVSLPLTLPFAIVSIILFRQQLDIFSLLGLLVLFGVIKKNAILVIDHIQALRERGVARAEAILAGNRDRLRPILMTTLAFVAGMVPLLFSKGIGSGFNHATAGVIVGGQILSLLLTLLATPVCYSLFDDAQVWMAKRFGRKADAPEAESA